MSRAKRGSKRRKSSNKILNRAEGFIMGRKSVFRRAAEAVDRAHRYAYRDRRNRKRDLRELWITRLNAAAYQNDMSYSRLVNAMKKSGVELNRKMLADIAVHDPNGFAAIVDQVRSQAPSC